MTFARSIIVRLAYWRTAYYNSRRMNEPENARRTIMGLSWCSRAYTHTHTHTHAYECPERHRCIPGHQTFVWLCLLNGEINLPNVPRQAGLELKRVLVSWCTIERGIPVGSLLVNGNVKWFMFYNSQISFLYRSVKAISTKCILLNSFMKQRIYWRSFVYVYCVHVCVYVMYIDIFYDVVIVLRWHYVFVIVLRKCYK